MELLKYDDQTRVIEFYKEKGSLMTYYDKVKLIKSTFLDPLAKDYKEKVEQK
jgi:hypothetical protein